MHRRKKCMYIKTKKKKIPIYVFHFRLVLVDNNIDYIYIYMFNIHSNSLYASINLEYRRIRMHSINLYYTDIYKYIRIL